MVIVYAAALRRHQQYLEDGCDRHGWHVLARHLIERAQPELGPHLVWHGWQRDILPILARCDVAIQTSRNEGTPVALIQAMAAGRPFLSTAVGGVVDMTCGQARSLTPGAAWFGNAVLTQLLMAGVVTQVGATDLAPRRTR